MRGEGVKGGGRGRVRGGSEWASRWGSDRAKPAPTGPPELPLRCTRLPGWIHTCFHTFHVFLPRFRQTSVGSGLGLPSGEQLRHACFHTFHTFRPYLPHPASGKRPLDLGSGFRLVNNYAMRCELSRPGHVFKSSECKDHATRQVQQSSLSVSHPSSCWLSNQ